MANTTPIHNKNIVALSVLIEDPSAGADDGIKAATDGGTYSSVYREQKMQYAYSAIPKAYREAFGNRWIEDNMYDLVTTQTISAFVTAGVAVNKDILFPLHLIRASTSQIYLPRTLHDVTVDTNPYVDYAFVLNAGKIYVYQRSAGTLAVLNILTGGTFYYAKAERINSTTGALLAANTAPDLILPTEFHPACVHYAAHLVFLDRGDDVGRQKAALEMEAVKSLVPKEVAAKL